MEAKKAPTDADKTTLDIEEANYDAKEAKQSAVEAKVKLLKTKKDSEEAIPKLKNAAKQPNVILKKHIKKQNLKTNLNKQITRYPKQKLKLETELSNILR